MIYVLVIHIYVDHLLYWVSSNDPAVKMASLDGTGQVTLLSESKAKYVGIAVYNNVLYISDSSRRFVFCIVSSVRNNDCDIILIR